MAKGVSGTGRSTGTRRVRRTLNPDLSTVHLVTDSANVVIDSLGFWFKRLSELACPDCGAVGSINIEVASYGIIAVCSRVEARYNPCDFEEEVHYRAGA